jgi:5-methylcytosine-specific restriction endonuclease McrA
MSPVRACNLHGRPNCRQCAARRHLRHQQAARSYSNTAAYRQMVGEVLEEHGDRCVYCGEPVEPVAAGPDALELAHYPIAHADGGEFVLENLRPSHRDCNRRAGR